MESSPEQDDWVFSVLGLDLTRPPMHAPAGKLLPIWVEAKDEIDAGIAQLQKALSATGDADLQQIAEYGLNGATTGQSAELMAALRDLDQSGKPESLDRVGKAVSDYRNFLNGSRIVDLLEDNPFGVAVPIRRRLDAALGEILAQTGG
jgi:hypothetical protein